MLPTYGSFDEKREVFFHKVINTMEELREALKQFQPRTVKLPVTGKELTLRYLFRGVNNSSYKMLSSFQRHIDSHGVPVSEMPRVSDRIINAFRSNDFLMKQVPKDPNQSEVSDLAIWAYVQHFGGPSHFVDFSSEVASALFFAFDGCAPSSDGDEMSHYVSLYVYPDNKYQTGELSSMYGTAAASATKHYADLLAKYPDAEIDTTNFNADLRRQHLCPELCGAMSYGGDESEVHSSLPNERLGLHSKVDNANIRAQFGNFFQASMDSMSPLEDAPLLRQAYRDVDGAQILNRYGTCLEINKSLESQIIAAFAVPSRDDVYPQFPEKAQIESEIKKIKDNSIPIAISGIKP